VDRYRRFEDWYKHTQDVAGPFYLWLVEHLFVKNELVGGTLTVDGARVDLANIGCPVNMLAGAADHITPPEQVFALADHVSTPPADMFARTTRGGHLGLFMANEALRDHWPVVMAAVLERSRHRARAGRPAAAA
jgi:poly(3-hydroxyalkanoate) synthetase